MSGRPVDKVVADLLDAVGAASELVGRGRDAYDNDRLLRFAGEAVIGRVGGLSDQHKSVQNQGGSAVDNEQHGVVECQHAETASSQEGRRGGAF